MFYMILILASESPARRKLLEQAGFKFNVMPANIDEQGLINELKITKPTEHVITLSKAKAQHVLRQVVSPSVIIAADTVIYHEGKILEKPIDEKDAFNMLKGLQGKMHEVYTGVTIIKKSPKEGDFINSFCDTTQVHISQLENNEILSYIKTGEPKGKSGSYSISGLGSLLIDKIKGDFNTVVGLPLARIYVTLKTLGVDLMDFHL